jgi:hypothetical protein
MNLRRFMTDMGLAHHLRRVSRTLSLARRDQPVFGATLNRSESAGPPAASPVSIG